MTKQELLEFVNSLDDNGNYHGSISEDILVKQLKTINLPIIENNEIVGYEAKTRTTFRVEEHQLLYVESGEYMGEVYP